MQDEIFENLIKNSLKEIGFKLCAVVYEEKYIVATKDNTTKIIYKIELINKSILETNMMDVLGNEDKIIYEFRKFEIVEDVIE